LERLKRITVGTDLKGGGRDPCGGNTGEGPFRCVEGHCEAVAGAGGSLSEDKGRRVTMFVPRKRDYFASKGDQS